MIRFGLGKKQITNTDPDWITTRENGTLYFMLSCRGDPSTSYRNETAVDGRSGWLERDGFLFKYFVAAISIYNGP